MEDVARIDDIVIDSANGHVVYCVLTDVGGMGDRMVAVPFNALSNKGERLFTLNTTKERLLAAPAFRSDDINKRSFALQVYTYFGLQPYWEGE